MIDMSKKYKTRDGRDVRVACVDAGSNAPVVAVIDNETIIYNAEGNYSSSIGKESVWDLIEVSPYADFKIDEPVMVRDAANSRWEKRYFAGEAEGLPQTWYMGTTKWSNDDDQTIGWHQCRRPTAEELAQ